MPSPMNYLGYSFWPPHTFSQLHMLVIHELWNTAALLPLQDLPAPSIRNQVPRGRDSIGALPGPCTQTIPRMSSHLLQHLGAAVCHDRILGFNRSDAQTQCHCVSCHAAGKGRRCWHPRHPWVVWVYLCVCVLSPASFCLSWKGERSRVCVFVLGESYTQELWEATTCPWLTVTPCQHPQCAVPLSLGRSALLLVEWDTNKVAAVSLSQGRESRYPRWLQAGGSPRLEHGAMLHITPAPLMIQWQSENSLFLYSPSRLHIIAGAVKQISSMNKVIKFVSKPVWSINCPDLTP